MMLINWFKTLFRMVNNYDALRADRRTELNYLQRQIASLNTEMAEAVKLIKHRTSVNADIRYRGRDRNQVIIVGRYHNRDYIEVFTISDYALRETIERLREMQRYGVVDRVDAAPEFRSVIRRELSE